MILLFCTQVLVERLDPASPGGEPRKRAHIATEHFAAGECCHQDIINMSPIKYVEVTYPMTIAHLFTAGTTANDVCVHISEKYGSDLGIWLLQMKVRRDIQKTPPEGVWKIWENRWPLHQSKV